MIEELVGRHTEISVMLENFYKIQEPDLNHPRIVLIEGEAGIGKSFIIQKFLDILEKDLLSKGLSVWIGKGICNNVTGDSTSFLPFYQVLDNLRLQKYHGNERGLDKFNQIMGEIAPGWLKMLPFIGESLASTAQGIRELQKDNKLKRSFTPSKQTDIDIYGQYLKVLKMFSGNRPVIIIIDDLQWADYESLNLLVYLAQHLPESQQPIMIIGAFRQFVNIIDKEESISPGQAALLSLRQKRNCLSITLESFTKEELDDYIDRVYNLNDENRFKHFNNDFRSTIYTQTGGNPLFVSELLKNLEEKGEIFKAGNAWRQRDSIDLTKSSTLTLDAIIEERFYRLEEKAKELLTIASVEGENFTAQVVSNIRDTELLDVLEILTEQLSRKQRLVQEIEEKQIAYRRFVSLFAFRHGLFRNFLYKRLGKAQKRILHQEVADCLENLYGEDQVSLIASQLAKHYLIAQDHPKIIKYGSLAARQEFDKYAVNQALWWSDIVLTEVGKYSFLIGEEQEYILETEFLRIEAYFHLGRNNDAMDEIAHVEVSYDLSEDLLSQARLAFWKGEILARKGELSNAEKILQESQKIFHGIEKYALEALAIRRLGHLNAARGFFETAHSQWLLGIERAKIAGDKEVEALIWSEVAEFAIDAGDLPKSDSASKNALLLFKQLSSRQGIAITLQNMGFSEYIRGNTSRSAALFKEALNIFREIEDGLNLARCGKHLANCYVDQGNLEDADIILKEVLVKSLEMDEVGNSPEVYISLARLYMAKRDFTKALEYVQRAVDIVEDDDQYSWPRTRIIKGQILIESGEIDAAEPWLLEAVHKTQSSDYKYVKAFSQLEYAKYLIFKGRKDEAKVFLDTAYSLFTLIGAQRNVEEVELIRYKMSN